jgi:hypothetical protein
VHRGPEGSLSTQGRHDLPNLTSASDISRRRPKGTIDGNDPEARAEPRWPAGIVPGINGAGSVSKKSIRSADSTLPDAVILLDIPPTSDALDPDC